MSRKTTDINQNGGNDDAILKGDRTPQSNNMCADAGGKTSPTVVMHENDGQHDRTFQNNGGGNIGTTSADAGKTSDIEHPHAERHIAWKLFWSFLKIGAFTFGGGYAMITLIQREVTDKHKWVDPDHFFELLTLAQAIPGPIAINTAVFVGYRLGHKKGAIAAIFGAVLPAFTIILLIAMFFADIKDNHAVEAVFKGMRPAVVALIVAPLFGFTKGMGAYRIGIAVLVAATIWRLGVSPAWFILVGIIGGLMWAYYRKRKEAAE